ncbi:hypothetical protein D3C71_512220 [compost metagenome]
MKGAKLFRKSTVFQSILLVPENAIVSKDSLVDFSENHSLQKQIQHLWEKIR